MDLVASAGEMVANMKANGPAESNTALVYIEMEKETNGRVSG